jgi:cellobiose phosphorylase
MSTVVQLTGEPGERTESAPRVTNRYGHFSPDGSEYCITDPRTPRPWANVIANPRLGLAVSQTGSGYTWVDNSQLAAVTRWQQDLAQDISGKFLYLRDAESGQIWSLSPAPVWAQTDAFTCRHGLGYTTFICEVAGIRATWTLYAHVRKTIELWRVVLENLSPRPRRLELCAYLEWCCGVAPSPQREFQKLFIETAFDAERRTVFARSHMWDVPTREDGHWNRSFPYVSALACSEPIQAAQGDKTAFLGRYGDLRSPAALTTRRWESTFGRHEDPVAALRSVIELPPRGTRQLGYGLAVAETEAAVAGLLADALDAGAMNKALEEVRTTWRARLAAHQVETPEPSLNYLANDWLRYQAISARLWGRCGYYQQSGAYGFRDQLQDAQVWLTIEPAHCREQINLHASHQFADGSVYHWWHPLTEQGLTTRMSDDLLWLAFVAASYVRETGRLDVVQDAVPFVDDDRPQPLAEHVRRAFERVGARSSPRGLPYIGAGDWNDGLSAVGRQERGESIWLAQFLAGLLADWAAIHRRRGDAGRAQELEQRRRSLVEAINEHGWDGDWYLRATLDDGTKLGSVTCRTGQIFLNAQTWAVLNDVATPERAARCMAAVKAHLVTEAGALLLAPAFDEPNARIGYITRYAPGLRENGGVYTHAATWAIAAACKVRDHDLAGRLLQAINPALKDPERYWAEPYVTPGNVDGPASPHHGRGGWTWYTGSAAWLHRVVSEWVLGVRPEWDGLRVDPCLPPGWPGAHMVRPWRGSTYRIQIERTGGLPADSRLELTVDGARLSGNLIAPPGAMGKVVDVRVRCR